MGYALDMATPLTELTENQRIGREVRTWMIRLDVTQAEIATVLGFAQKNVSKRIRGEMPFRIDELLRIAVLMDITLGQLLGDDLVNEKNPHLVSGEGSHGRNTGQLVAGDGFEPSTSGL